MGKKDSAGKEFIKKPAEFAAVVTIVLFLNAEKWDGPMSLHDMLDFEGVPEEVRDMVADYKIHILEPCSIEDAKLDKVESSLGMVLGAIKYSESKDDFRKFINEHEEKFSSFPNYAAEVIDNFCTWDIPEEEMIKESVNMCKAVVELREEGREEGKVLAYYDMNLSVSEIAEKCHLAEDKVKEILQNK